MWNFSTTTAPQRRRTVHAPTRGTARHHHRWLRELLLTRAALRGDSLRASHSGAPRIPRLSRRVSQELRVQRAQSCSATSSTALQVAQTPACCLSLDSSASIVRPVGCLTHAVASLVHTLCRLCAASPFKDFLCVSPRFARTQALSSPLCAGYIALGTSVCGFAQGYAFSTVADRLTNTLRRAYLSALLKSEIGFFDLSPTGALVSRLATDVALVQQAVGVKLGVFTQARVFCSIIFS